MPNPPTFFFSHARQDREAPGKYLLAFFEDLERKLASWAGVNLDQKTRLGTIDERVPHGDNWDDNLSLALSSDNAFVAILSPLYFNRENCGKEVAVFLFRSSGLGIDANGSLTGVENFMPIRWLPEAAYAINGIRDSLVPKILKLVEDVPAATPRNPERRRAIERYRQKGMEKCVRGGKYYDELLDAFVEVIRDWQKLPPQPKTDFVKAVNAFNFDWSKHFNTAAQASTPSPLTTQRPTPLSSIVAFYVTPRTFEPCTAAVDFADHLIAEPAAGEPTTTDPALSALFADVRKAGLAEKFSVFHAAVDPAVPSQSTRLLDYLVRLSNDRIRPLVVVDPSVWAISPETPERAAMTEILRSSDWSGSMVVPALNGTEANIPESERTNRLVPLPADSEQRVAQLSNLFFRLRAESTRSSETSTGEKPPMLQGPRAEGS
jgi:hypothetical protein